MIISVRGITILHVQLVNMFPKTKIPYGAVERIVQQASSKGRFFSSKPPKTEDAIYSYSGSHLNSHSHSPPPPTINKHKNKYISFKDFPKAPESILKQSAEELFSNIDIKPTVQTTGTNDNFVDFSIPDKYLKSQIKEEVTEKDKALVEELDNFLKSNDQLEQAQSQLNFIKLYYDQDTNLYQPLPEHTLKKSLSGMINLNPSLDDIDDEYLWKLIPKDKTFGSPPFEQSLCKDGFKQWEKVQLQKHKTEMKEEEINNKEFEDFKQSLHNSKTFFKVNSTGRRKLDRKLLKRYKQLKQQGKVPKDFNLIKFDDVNDL